MQYISTRGLAAPKSFQEVLLAGLAEDGGLYVPEHLPAFTRRQFDNLRDLSYVQVAQVVLGLLMDDIPSADLDRIITDAYASDRFGPEVVPLQKLDNDIWLMKLSEGPTLAFKDIGLQLVGRLMSYALEKSGESTLNILGATSGDTGSAAAYAVRGSDKLRLFMLSPKDRMSDFQRAQMYTLNDPRIHNLVVDGTFDDCQTLVKEINGDAAFKAFYNIGAMNSINYARIAAQVVYYFWAALRTDQGKGVTFSIPSGNFGNALAAHTAGMMGVPIHEIFVATNENDVLKEFFSTGVYRPRKGQEVHVTSSPSMDIALASNFERYVHDMVPKTGVNVGAWVRALEEKGYCDFGKAPRGGEWTKGPPVFADSVTENEVLETIQLVYEVYGVIIDPHTAVAMAMGLRGATKDVPLVVAETAQPAKFEKTIEVAVGIKPPRPKSCKGSENLPEYVTHIPADAEVVKDFIREHVHD